jgi:hypothetical protein
VFEHGETPEFVAPVLPQDGPGQQNRRTNVKTVSIAMLLATAIVSPLNAESWIKVERPCGSGSSSKCVAPRPILRPVPVWSVVGGVKFSEIKDPDYQSRTVIKSDYGTSVYTYRSFSR